MGYEIQMQKTILRLLQLFKDHVPDKETHAWVFELAANEAKWLKAHDLFNTVRKRLLAIQPEPGMKRDEVETIRARQYSFEESCLQSVFNETNTKVPFDACSPFWVASSAIYLARALEIPVERVVEAIAPSERA